MILLLGNPSPRRWVKDDEATGEGHYENVPVTEGLEEEVTRVLFPEGISVSEATTTMLSTGGVWTNHSDGLPTWVASDSPLLAAMIADATGAPVVPMPEED